MFPSILIYFSQRQSQLYLEAKKQYGNEENVEDQNLHAALLKSNVYTRTHFSNLWLLVTIILHIIFFCFLFGVGSSALPPFALVVVVGLSIIAPILLLIARYLIVNKSYKFCGSDLSIESETDQISDRVILIMCAAILVEVLAFAMFPAISSGRLEAAHSKLSNTGFYSYSSISQILTFTAVVLSAFYRTLRPSNRLDPFRTIMEV
jgi:hypothetical protein